MAKNGNGKRIAPADQERITLSLAKGEQTSLREREQRLGQFKIELANAYLQRSQIDAQCAELTGKIQAEGQAYEAEIRVLARAKGIDVERGVQFDPNAMTVTGEKA